MLDVRELSCFTRHCRKVCLDRLFTNYIANHCTLGLISNVHAHIVTGRKAVYNNKCGLSKGTDGLRALVLVLSISNMLKITDK